MGKDKTIVYMICNDKQIKMTRDVFDYLMTVKHYNKKLKDEIIKLQQENKELKESKNKAIEELTYMSTDGYTDNYDIRDKHYNLLMNILQGSDKE